MFPYYEASPELKDFLNNTRINGVPITSLPINSTIQTNPLIPTDLTHINVPIPLRRLDRPTTTQLAIRQRLHDEVPWMVANQQGQCFSLPGDPSAIVILSPGTLFNAAALRTVALRCGTAWILTGARPAAVLTKYGAVEISPNSIVGVEQ